MFEDLILFSIVFIANSILGYFLFKRPKKPHIISKIVGVVGIFFHELSHFVIAIITGAIPGSFKVSYRNQNGSVRLKDFERWSFLQKLLTGIAPLFITSYLAYWCLWVCLESSVPEFFKLISFFLLISLITGASPSRIDIKNIGKAFNNDPIYSSYQLGLLILSTIVVYFTTSHLEIPYYFSFLFYILIGIGYYLLKYSFIGVRKLGEHINRNIYNRRSSTSSFEIYRKRHVPKKKKKERIERGQW